MPTTIFLSATAGQVTEGICKDTAVKDPEKTAKLSGLREMGGLPEIVTGRRDDLSKARVRTKTTTLPVAIPASLPAAGNVSSHLGFS